MNENKFTPTAEEALRLAQEAAGELGHGYVGTEHLLLGLMREDEGMAHTVLTEAGLTDDLLTEMVRKSVGAGLPGGNPAQGLTPRAKHVVEIAMEDSIRGGYAYIGTEHLLAGILREGNNMAVRILRSAGVDARQLYTALMKKLTAAPRAAQSGDSRTPAAGSAKEDGKGSKTLAEFTRDLTADARTGKLDPVIGRDDEIQRVIQILSRRTKNNPCLIGEPGVGKTAVADIKNLSLTGYQVIKYTLDESKYDGGAKNINSIPLIRYAEVLLNYAEAQAELGVLTDSEWALTVGALRKRAGITGGTETLPTTVDSYLQRTFYPDVTSPVLLEIRRERAIELVAEGMRFDDLRRWKCGSLMETLPWSGIHIPGLEQPVDVNGDGVNDYYFTEGEVASAPAAYKNIAVRVNQDGVGLYAEANAVSGYDLVYKTGAGDRYWYPDGRQYLYPIPAKVIRDYRNAGYTISQNPEWDNE
mgnify:CR=1 FL=1